MSRERRVFPRVPMMASVRVEHGGDIREGSTADLSVGGLCLVGVDSVRLGDTVGLQVTLSDETSPLATQALCVWVDDRGVGLCFVGLGEDGRAQIRAAIERVAREVETFESEKTPTLPAP